MGPDKLKILREFDLTAVFQSTTWQQMYFALNNIPDFFEKPRLDNYEIVIYYATYRFKFGNDLTNKKGLHFQLHGTPVFYTIWSHNMHRI